MRTANLQDFEARQENFRLYLKVKKLLTDLNFLRSDFTLIVKKLKKVYSVLNDRSITLIAFKAQMLYIEAFLLMLSDPCYGKLILSVEEKECLAGFMLNESSTDIEFLLAFEKSFKACDNYVMS